MDLQYLVYISHIPTLFIYLFAPCFILDVDVWSENMTNVDQVLMGGLKSGLLPGRFHYVKPPS